MKKIVLLSLMSLIMFSGITYATEMKSCIPSPPGFWVRFGFAFHRPSKDCLSGFGLCVDVTAGFGDSMSNVEKNLCPVRAQINDKNQLIVEITEDALSKYEKGTTLPYFKGKSNINILDPYTLSAGTCKALGSSKPIMIKPGIYPLVFDNGTYTVTFQL